MSTNLITNPNFAGNSLAGWDASGSNVGAYAGYAAFSLRDTANGGVLSQVVNVTAGDTYNFNFNYGGANAAGMQGTVTATYRVVAEPSGTILVTGNVSDSTPLNWSSGAAADSYEQTSFTVPSGVTSVRIEFIDSSLSTGRLDLVVDNVYVAAVCFSAGTLIETNEGSVPVSSLRVGDRVLTLENGYKPIRWIGKRRLTSAELRAYPNLRPILIRKGALGRNMPETNLVVSPQHRIMIKSQIAKRVFGQSCVLLPAKKLLKMKGVSVIKHDAPVEYWHFICDEHQIVKANGTPAETLYLGVEAMKTLCISARKEIEMLFPELYSDAEPEPATLIAPREKIDELVSRHQRNEKKLIQNNLRWEKSCCA